MKMIMKIFHKDINGLTRNFFACVIAIGLCIIPSLYAWFNIYSNWNPYANTSSLKVAVTTEDVGYVNADGTVTNMGDKIIEQLGSNDKLGWVFPDSTEDALEGVYSGKYYAAIVIGSDFSESLYDFIENGMEHPSVTYYENSKKNAVAAKITDTGKSTLQQNINEEFINIMVDTVLEGLQEMTDGDTDKLETVINQISAINDNLNQYNETIDLFIESNKALSNSLYKVKNLIPEVSSTIDSTVDTADLTRNTVETTADVLVNKLDSTLTTMGETTDAIITNLDTASSLATTNAPAAAASLNSAAKELNSLSQQTEALKSVATDLSSVSGVDSDNISSTLDSLALVEEAAGSLIQQSSALLSTSPAVMAANYALIKPLLTEATAQMKTINNLHKSEITPKVKELESSISQSMDSITDSLSEIGDNLGGVGTICDDMSSMVLSANNTMESTKSIIEKMSNKLNDIVSKLDEVEGDEKYQLLVDILNADAKTYAEFLAEPVQVTQVDVYQAANYGTSVTPFYTTLALWVGIIVLVALIKVHAEPVGEFKAAKPYQLFFGRFLLFFLMGQLQSLIVVIGDLYLLRIQCQNVGLFFFASAVTSFVFSTLIYAITISFGDAGKALVVVMVVIQIAGSSGTYPIELLPKFFQSVYLYFPFPYAINAMREAISGMYQNDYWIYLGKLLVFAGAGLLIGLVIRKPFMKLNHFVEKRMKDTQMM